MKPGIKPKPPIERLMNNLSVIGSCWIYNGTTTRGYGRISNGIPTGKKGHKKTYTHRLSYEHFIGPIPAGSQIHHVCHNKRCCNPDHLELLTPTEHALAHSKFECIHCGKNPFN